MLEHAAPAKPVLPQDHPPVSTGGIGILLVNLGTPEGTDYWSMRRYLKEFLSDRRVIETNRVLWWFILNGIILTTRPKKSGHAYEQIWNKELDESPLKTITRDQCKAVESAFADYPNIHVDWAMRYGLPPIAERLEALKDCGCDRIIVFPLYPQYSAATTATVMDKTFDAMKKMRWQPAIRCVPAYHDDPAYIAALGDTLQRHLDSLDWQPDKVVASFHGLPVEYLHKGDPYHCQCLKTARLLREHLGWPEGKLIATFQSRFGKAEWLQPYTDETVDALPQQGVKNLVIITPGFAADCVETLEEIGLGVCESYLEKGGENVSVVPCLNAGKASISMLKDILMREAQGWI